VESQFRSKLRAVGKEVWQELRDDRLSNGAAVMAFYTMLALFPIAIFGLSSLRFLPIPNLQQAIFDLLQEVMPGSAADLFKQSMQDILSKRHTGLLSFGLLFAIFSGSSGLFAVMQQLNAVYGATEHRSFWKTRLISVLLMSLFFVLLIVTFGLVIFGGALHDWLAHALGWSPMLALFFAGFRWLVILFFLLSAFAATYRWGPDVKGPLKLFTAGNVCATLGLLLASFAFRLYVSNFASYDGMYGGLGAAIVLQLWLFIVGWATLVGGAINDAIDRYEREGAQGSGSEPWFTPSNNTVDK
jgi:membrane protein